MDFSFFDNLNLQLDIPFTKGATTSSCLPPASGTVSTITMSSAPATLKFSTDLFTSLKIYNFAVSINDIFKTIRIDLPIKFNYKAIMIYCHDMKSNKLIRVILLSIVCSICLPIYSRSLNPNKVKIDTLVSVIDTIPAIELFEQIKPSILEQINELNDKHITVQSMLSSNQKKAKTELEKALVRESYYYALNHTKFYKYDLFGEKKEKDAKDANKGKITETIKSFLSQYDETYLLHNIGFLTYSLENDWTSFLDNPPMKSITIPVANPYYRGLHYNNYYFLNEIEQGRLLGDYEFVIKGDGVKKEETYPIEVSYLQFPQLPNYRVINNSSMEIYNTDGKLVYVPVLKRQSNTELLPISISKEIMRLVYLKDYKSNKYNIRTANIKTHNFLNLWIGRKQGLTKSKSELDNLKYEGFFRGSGGLLGTNTSRSNETRCREILALQERYEDDPGERYIKQLESDHADEFGYLYAIERLADKKFLIVYLNKSTLQPSISAIVTFSSGSEPYTSDFSVQLCDMPKDVPPVIKE